MIALHSIGFESIVADDGRAQFHVWDQDGFSARMDVRVACAAQRGQGTSCVLYNQRLRECRIVSAALARRCVQQQRPPSQ
jgi:hypothetical protein